MPLLVAQQQKPTIVSQAVAGQAQRLLEERLRLQALQREIAETQQHLDPRFAAVQLLGQPRRQRRLPVPLRAIGTHALDEPLDFLDREWLRQIVVGAVAQAEDRGVDRWRSGDQHDRRRGLLAFHGAQQVQAAQPGHLDVGYDEVERVGVDPVEGLLGGRRRRDRAPARGERGDEEAQERGVVVDGEHAERGGRSHGVLPWLICPKPSDSGTPSTGA